VRHRLYLCSLAILIVGLCGATAIYFLTDDLPDHGDGYVIVDGQKYPAGVYQSKRYQRELERYGGKANVIFAELDRWLASLWHGKRLGITLAWISVVASLGLFLAARFLYPEQPPPDRDGS
jgi:hypothetical protein